jgi:lysophospholipase L1-like esterase
MSPAQEMEILQVNRTVFRTAFLTAATMAGLLISTGLAAQNPGNQPPETKVPAAQAAPAPQPAAAPVSAAPKPNEYNPKLDWPWLGKFKEADLALAPPASGENRVVFMGDSITQGWDLGASFPGKPYINRGISGQTTPQMLVRFRQDVIALKPKVVVILAGTNDVAGNTGPMTLEQTEDNLASMADLATANHIRVVLCSVLPAVDFGWHPGQEPAPKIVALNAWIKAYAAGKGYVYVDYHTAMKDERNGLPPTLSHDGVHPLPAGYAMMAPLAQAGIDQALAQ